MTNSPSQVQPALPFVLRHRGLVPNSRGIDTEIYAHFVVKAKGGFPRIKLRLELHRRCPFLPAIGRQAEIATLLTPHGAAVIGGADPPFIPPRWKR